MSKKAVDISFYERQKLEYWLRTKQSLRTIAKLRKRDHSVLVRELKRNGSGNRRRYRADTAERLFKGRQHQQHRGKLDKYPELKMRVGMQMLKVSTITSTTAMVDTKDYTNTSVRLNQNARNNTAEKSVNYAYLNGFPFTRDQSTLTKEVGTETGKVTVTVSYSLIKKPFCPYNQKENLN